MHYLVCGARLQRVIARGHYSTVWEGTNIADNVRRAIKIFDVDRLAVESAMHQFRRGVHAMQHLGNAEGRPASIIPLDQVEPSGLAFSMPYIPGGDLTQINTLGWSLEHKLVIFQQVCEAVAFAHEQHVLHRDVKPANIVLDERQRPVLMDFDIADPVFLHTLSVREPGTIAYSAPEQLSKRGRRDASADVYSLGRLLLFLLIERDPEIEFHPTPDVGELAHARDPLTRSLRRIIRQCTCRDPERRYPTVRSVLDDVCASAGSRLVGIESAGEVKARNTMLALLAAGVLGFVAWTFWPKPLPNPEPPYRLVGSETVIEAIINPRRSKIEEETGISVSEPAREGSENALQSLLEDPTMDGGMMSRHPDDLVEEEPRYRGVNLAYVTVAFGEMVLCVHASNPIRQIRVEDLQRLLFARAPDRPENLTWGDLGVKDPAWRGRRVVVFVPARKEDLESGSMKLIERCLSPGAGYAMWRFLENSPGRTPWIASIPDSFVAVREDALGLSERSFVRGDHVKIVAVHHGADLILMRRPLMFAARLDESGVESRMRRLLELLLRDDLQRQFGEEGLVRISEEKLMAQRELLARAKPDSRSKGVRVHEVPFEIKECWGLKGPSRP